MKPSALAVLFIVLSAPLLAQPGTRANDGAPSRSDVAAPRVGIVASTGSGLTIDVAGIRAKILRHSGIVAVGHNAASYFFQDDSASVPGLRFIIGVPPGASGFTVTLTTSHGDTIPLSLGAGSRLLWHGPERPEVSVRTGGTIYGLRTMIVEYRPVRIRGEHVTIARDARIKLGWTGGVAAATATAASVEITPVAETMLSSMVLNYPAARSWIAGPRRDLAARMAPAERKMGEALVMMTPREGIYRLRSSDMAAAGVQPGMPIPDLRVRTRDQFIRFYVNDANGDGAFNGDDFLEFHGWRNRSPEGFYFDETTDTNAFILTWRGGDGGGPLLTAASGTGDAPPLVAYDSTLHREEEHTYNLGPSLNFGTFSTDVMTVHNPDRVANERYYWGSFIAMSGEDFAFDCSPKFDPNDSVTIRVRVVGQTFRPHGLRFWLNGTARFGEITFKDTNDVTASFRVPASYLVNGRNILGLAPFETDPENKRPDMYFFDYLEIEGKWLPSTFDDVATLRLPGGPRRVTVDGLRADPAVAIGADRRTAVDTRQKGFLFRLSSRQFIVPERVNPGFVVNYPDDTIRQAAQYQFGLYIGEADGASGRFLRGEFFSLDQPGGAEAAAARLAAIPNGNIVVAGFALGALTQSFPEGLRNAFTALGSTAASRSDMGNASWCFVARKGSAETAQERFASLPENNVGVTLNAFIPSENGRHYRAVLTLDGAPGEEVAIGPALTPALRYHKADELTDPANRADLMIITHRAFRDQAERLAQHRRDHEKYVVKVIDVDQVYDEFNDGIKSAEAIRRFLMSADQGWASPKPAYVLLFGDASNDPQRRDERSHLIDYVPTWGVPSSDYMLTVYPGDSTDSSHQFIGRLSATSPADATAIVDKLIEYDTQPPQWWNKRFVAITGGQTLGERAEFETDAINEAVDFILAPTFQGDTAIVHRTDTDADLLSRPSEKEGPWARQEINKGALMVTYSGHGSGNVVELNYGFPGDFDNEGKYFVLATFSCQTGAYGESDVPVRNERFVFAPGKGAIGAIGGTSFSYIGLDREFRTEYYRQITVERKRRIGEILSLAKESVFGPYRDVWAMTLPSFQRRNAALAYNLIGDPSMSIAVRNTPELALDVKDLSVTNKDGKTPELGDSTITVNARLWNYGVPIDLATTDTAISVIATIIDRKGNEVRDTVVVNRLGRSAPLLFELPIGQQPGEYVVRIEADPLRQVTETYLPDNVISTNVPIRGNQPLVLEPRPFGRVIGYDNIQIRLLNPPSGPGADIVVDTTDRFDSPARFGNATTGQMRLGELTTAWTFSIPQELRSARRFFWRAIATTGDPDVAKLFPLVESFTVDPPGGEEYAIGGPAQMTYADNVNLANRDAGIGPGRRKVEFKIRSVGQNGTELPVVFTRNDASVRSGNYPGMNLILVDPATGEVLSASEFAWFTRGPDQRRFLDYVRDSIKDGQLVMLAARYATWGFFRGDAADSLDTLVKAALTSLGSTAMDSIAEDDTYILIGGKNVPASFRRELWLKTDSLVALGRKPPFLDSLVYPMDVSATAGRLTLPSVGPARAWRALHLDISQSAPVTVTAFGIRRDGVRDSLLSVATLDTVDLRSVDAAKYPQLEMRLNFPNDTLSRLRSAYVDFDPSPELAIVPSSVGFERDSVLQGDPGLFHATIVNLSGRFAADSTLLQVLLNDENQAPPVQELKLRPLAPLDSTRETLDISTDRYQGKRSFAFVVNPSDVPGELYRQNNRVVDTLRVGGDKVTPSITIYADGNRLMEGDYVNPEPLIEVRVFDNSQLKLSDTSTVTMILDNDFITASSPGASFKPGGKGEQRGTFYYRPQHALSDGPHDIRLFTVDATGNGDTTEFIRFYVERDLHVREVVNVPNPFQERTTFTFMVSGATPPVGGEIAIFTVAGRKIKAIPLTAVDLHVGFNKIDWDGLDADGDRLANGVYLYRVTVENGESKDQVIEKIVVMR